MKFSSYSTFLTNGALVGLVFFSVYPTTNWLAELRGDSYYLFLAWELGIPLVPEFVWFYLSMYVLFALPPFFLSPGELTRLGKQLITATCLAGLFFLAVPARLGFPRLIPPNSPYHQIFATIFAVDAPYNLVPSLHVVYSTIIVLAIATRLGRLGRVIFFVWLALLCVSTILVHQHHLLDIITGLALAFCVYFCWMRREGHA